MSEERKPAKYHKVTMPIEEAKRAFHVIERDLQESRRSLRMWFLAYAVGAPAVLISNSEAFAIVLRSRWSLVALILFFLAIVIQVIGEMHSKAVIEWQRSSTIRELYPDTNWPPSTSASRVTQRLAELNRLGGDRLTFACLALATAIVVLILFTHDPAASLVPTTLPVP